MKKFVIAAFAAAIATAPFATAYAQPHRDHDRHDGFRRHNEWRKGGRISRDDWNRGRPVDWRARHLSAPRRGYEWREVDGNYVMAAVAGGLIGGLIAGAAH